MPTHKHWHQRGYLAHFDGSRVVQSITYRLADSLPKPALVRMEAELQSGIPDEKRSLLLRRRIDEWLGGGHGSCLLQRPDVAPLIIDNWRHFEPERYQLEAYVVMPNHVHVLIAMKSDAGLSKIVQSWKTYTAKHIQSLTNWTGAVWQADYWDRYIRDEEHYRRAVEYILENPVKAGLVKDVTAWPWSSAYKEMGHA